MLRRILALALAAGVGASAVGSAQGRLTQHGRATVEYRSPDVNAVAAYDYSQRNHSGPWLLIEFAVQAKERIAVHRDHLMLLGPDERSYPVATQAEFLEDHGTVTRLLQNASVLRQPLDLYFTSRPIQRTIRFFSSPGGVVHDSAITNPDEVAAGDLLFKSPSGRWDAGTYRLVLNHEKAKAALPIELR